MIFALPLLKFLAYAYRELWPAGKNNPSAPGPGRVRKSPALIGLNGTKVLLFTLYRKLLIQVYITTSKYGFLEQIQA